jgi:hypothetical protein
MREACKRWQNKYPARYRQIKRRAQQQYRKRHPEADAAHKLVEAAIKNKVMAQKPCVLTGSLTELRNHHYDYYKPLNVVPLREDMHSLVHKDIITIRETSSFGFVLIQATGKINGISIPRTGILYDTTPISPAGEPLEQNCPQHIYGMCSRCRKKCDKKGADLEPIKIAA